VLVETIRTFRGVTADEFRDELTTVVSARLMALAQMPPAPPA
jgi:hypothetical protein